MIVQIKATVPNALAQAFLQHVRDFDFKHGGCHFAITAVADMPTAEFVRILEAIDPPFASGVHVVPKQ